MSNAVRPSTLGGIKSLAKELKIELGIPHFQALDRASVQAGYQNFRHAQNFLVGQHSDAAPQAEHLVFVTAYWRDRETNKRGRETLVIRLKSQWTELIDASALPKHSRASNFYGVQSNHIECRAMLNSQSAARRRVCQAVRLLQFMDATQLRPSDAFSRAFPGGTSVAPLPASDHATVWYDRRSKRFLVADEPYEAAIKHPSAARAAWAERHGFVIARPHWPGMYNPDGGCQLYLVSHTEKGVPLTPIVASLDALPPPVTEETWSGESASDSPLFSPPEGQPLGTTKSARASKAVTKRPASTRIYHGRKLLITGINYLLQNNLVSLSGKDEEHQHSMAEIAGRPSVILWHGISGDELAVAVWWDYDHSKHPQANLEGNSRENFRLLAPLAKRRHYPKFVGGVVSGWLERKTGKYVQGTGRKGITTEYLRADAKAALIEMVNPVGNGFLAEGKFFL